jgi:hypothetical protein
LPYVLNITIHYEPLKEAALTTANGLREMLKNRRNAGGVERRKENVDQNENGNISFVTPLPH